MAGEIMEETKYEDYSMEDVMEKISSSRMSRFKLIEKQLRLKSFDSRKFSRGSVVLGIKKMTRSLSVIHPDNRWYRGWTQFILLWAVYSSFLTPLEFGFFRGSPNSIIVQDIIVQIAFLIDLVFQFFVAYRDDHTYRMVYKRRYISLRYLKSHFLVDLLGCVPWDVLHAVTGNREFFRYMLWVRLFRIRKVAKFFQSMEKDIRINYLFTRIVKLIIVQLYCTHTAACIFYYLATTVPPSHEGYTWIGSLNMGDFAYASFRDIDFWKRYITSLYWAIITMATIGYGDIHAVNVREMIFVMSFVSFDIILSAYLIGNMTALIVKGSKTEKFRDKMTDLMQYMNRNKLGRNLRNQIKGHLRLQYESMYTEATCLNDIPFSLRAQISQTLYLPYMKSAPLFKGCSLEFINQIVIRLHEEFFLPGEVIMEQGNVVDQLYFVCEGALEEVGFGEDGTEETISLLEQNSSSGEISILCNIPQPCTVRVCELSRLLRIEKQSFLNVLEIYFNDGRKIFNNIIEAKSTIHKQLEADITFHIGRQEAEVALRVNSTAYNGDLYQLKSLIRAGASPSRTDYDGRSPVHLAACRGYEDIILFLIQEGVDINVKDKFGNTPLLEAIRNGHDRVAQLLVEGGASLTVDDAGSFLCSAVSKGDSDFLKRVLSYGIDPNSKDYDHRTPLHVAASEGLYLMTKLLLDAGASVFSKDRWGKTPLDGGRLCGNKKVIKLLEEAKTTQLFELQTEGAEKEPRQKKCTVYPYHPREAEEDERAGVVVRVPASLEELIEEAKRHLTCPRGGCLLTEGVAKIVDVGLIDDGQRLYLVSDI